MTSSKTSRVAHIAAAALVAAALSIAAAAALAGCSLGGSTTTTTVRVTTTAAPITTTTQPETTTTVISTGTLGFGEKGTWNGITVTVESPEVDPAPALVGEGNRVVLSMVTITNEGKDVFDYNGLDFQLYDADENEYDSAGLSSVADLGQGSLAPGETAQGAVAFELPMLAKVATVDWQPADTQTPVFIWKP